jgi:hypothetical protein
MSRGIGTLNTNHKQEPVPNPGPPFELDSAQNGLSVDPITRRIVLGNDLGAPGDPAQLFTDREIQRNGRRLSFPDALFFSTFELNGDLWSGTGLSCSMRVGSTVTLQTTEIFTDGGFGISGLSNSHGQLIWFAASGGCVLDNTSGVGVGDPGANVFLITYPEVLIQGSLRNDRSVSAQAASPVAVSAGNDKNKVFTNEGATGAVTFNLPTAVAGLTFTFVVQDAVGIVISAAAGDTIRIDTLVTAAGGSVTSTAIGSSVTLVAINATEWVAIAALGTWV